MTHEIRKIIDIIEHKSLPMRKRSISTELDTYRLIRTLLRLRSGHTFTDGSEYNGGSVFTFYTQHEMDSVIDLLKELGISYTDISCKELKDNGEFKDTYTVSPVATNPYAAKSKK